jgi:hypothetical protein
MSEEVAYPGPGAGQVAASEVDPGCNDQSKDVERVPCVSLGRSMSRMGDLLNDNQGGHQEGRESETDNDSTSNKDWLLG